MDPAAKNIPTDSSLPRKKNLKPYLLLFIFLLILIAGIIIWRYLGNPKLSIKVEPNTGQQPIPTSFNNSTSTATNSLPNNTLPRFAEFKEESSGIKPSVPKYTLTKNDLVNLDAVEKARKKDFSDSQIRTLTDAGFFLEPAENLIADGEQEIDFRHGGTVDEYIMQYEKIAGDSAPEKRQPENTVFVSSDFLLHAYHVFIDRTFQSIEEKIFHSSLNTLVDSLYNTSIEEYQKASNPKLKDSLSRLISFYLVPKVILETSKPASTDSDSGYLPPQNIIQNTPDDTDNPENIVKKLDSYKSTIPDDVYKKTLAELNLINEAKGMEVSPLYGVYKGNELDDYSQYKPRSHYVKNSILRSYWKAMIWFGRNGFLVKSDEMTLDAIVQSVLLSNVKYKDINGQKLWETIYLPTVFFVGKSDDLSFYDYNTLVSKVYGTGPSYDMLSDGNKLVQFKEEIKKLPGPKIQSSILMITPGEKKEGVLAQTKSFRFMGQRFIPDSYIFSTLTQGDEGPDDETKQYLPSTPTALMPLSIFGNDQAKTYLNQWIKNNAPDSDKVIAKNMIKLTDEFNNFNTTDWTQNLYWSWLYTLKALNQKFGEGYPSFMQSSAWNDKDLNTALGSFTELRHDTLLYAKQSYAEMGGGRPQPTPPPVPKGFVEPNLTFLNRMIALSIMTKEGLDKFQLLPEEQKGKLDQMMETFIFYKSIVQKELQNQQITDEEFEKLRTSPLSLNFSLTPPDWNLAYMKTKEARAGLIADVHTDMKKGQVLYEATGIPNVIYVAVKDANGTRLTRGITYSYYEFTHPFGERLSDEDWQANIYEGKNKFPIPQPPAWAKALEK